MSELLFDRDAEIAAWVAERIPHVGSRGFGPCTAIGVVSGDQLIAGVVYHEYQPDFETIELSMAAENPMWARKMTICGLLAHPFIQLGVYKVWTATPIDNKAALRVNEHIGFKREGVLAHHFGRKRHAVICRMLQPDYRRIYGVKDCNYEPMA